MVFLSAQVATQTVQAVVTQVESRINMATFEPAAAPDALAVNDVGIIRLKTAKPIVYDPFIENHAGPRDLLATSVGVQDVVNRIGILDP